MKKTLRNIMRIGLVVGGLAILGGCVHGTPQEIGESVEYFWNTGDTEKKRKANSILITTPSGYNVNLHKGVSVYYNEQLCHIQEIVPPYVDLCGGSYRPGYYPCDALKVKIKDLDMFKE